jgi:hypothetical protein
VASLSCLAIVCLLTGCSSSSARIPLASKDDLADCNTISEDFYHPTIPGSGEKVTVTASTQVLALLNRANDSSLRAAAPGLRRAKLTMIRLPWCSPSMGIKRPSRRATTIGGR